jgi:adenine C2-methylase RlmN of 23S rRNA A2503 and tRNA A37
MKITNRTVTLNFIVMNGVEVSVAKLKKMGLNGDKFTVKLIPLNKTNNSESNELKAYANYSNYDKLVDLTRSFEQEGIPVVMDAIAKCEEAGLCCGQLVQIYEQWQ